jgi:hypothetical protein
MTNILLNFVWFFQDFFQFDLFTGQFKHEYIRYLDFLKLIFEYQKDHLILFIV